MSRSLPVSSITQTEIDKYVENLYPVVNLKGRHGSGKQQITNDIINKLCAKQGFSKTNPQYIMDINESNKTISIDDARAIKSWLKLKVIDLSETTNRLVVIRNAHKLTNEAQNALLKIIEETPKKTHFILNTDLSLNLLGTIDSRTQDILIVNPSVDECAEYFTCRPKEIISQYAMAGGRARYIVEIREDGESYFSKVIHAAKAFSSSPLFDRLCKIEEVNKEYSLELFLFSLAQIYKYLLRSADSSNKMQKYNRALRIISESEHSLNTVNVNPKLLLTHLAINL